MSKYTDEFKLQIVLDYLSGTNGFRMLSKHYGVDHKDISRWVGLYKMHGEAGIRRQPTSYSAEFKLSVIQTMLQSNWSIKQTAIQFNIASPSTVKLWLRRYNEGGLTVLTSQPKEWRPMRKKINYQMLLSKPVAELSHQELLDRLEYAETEIAYLKKLEALAQQQKLAPKIKSK
jgi:transposase